MYSGLLDKGGEVLPMIANDGARVVRIRADDDTAQMSGDQVKHPSEAGYIGPASGSTNRVVPPVCTTLARHRVNMEG